MDFGLHLAKPYRLNSPDSIRKSFKKNLNRSNYSQKVRQACLEDGFISPCRL